VSNPEKPEPMVPTTLPSRAWDHLAADCLGPLPSGEHLFTIVDYYSRWLEVVVMTKTTNADKVVKELDKLFTIYGLPASIATDNGPHFLSDTFKRYMEENGIAHRRITPLWPSANGEIERQNRSLLKRMKIANAERKPLETELQTYLKMYRSTPHSTTGVSPAELLFGLKLRTKLPDINLDYLDDIEIRDRDSERKEKGKLYSDKRRNTTTNDLNSRDQVLVKQNRANKLSTTFNPESFTILEKHGNSVGIQSNEGKKYRRNVTHVKKVIEREANENNTNMSNESVVQFEKENSDQNVSNENHESHASENIRRITLV
jgi:hypothetical protein